MSRQEGHTDVQFCQTEKKKKKERPGIRKILSSVPQRAVKKIHHRTEVWRIEAFSCTGQVGPLTTRSPSVLYVSRLVSWEEV